MAYLKPPPFVQHVFNPLAMRFSLGGATTLVVPRRRSGQPQTVPVIPVDYNGARYLVSTRGDAQWVRNLRAAGGFAELRRGTAVQRFRAMPVPADERWLIIVAYRAIAGRTVERYFEALPDPADHPVFRLDPWRATS